MRLELVTPPAVEPVTLAEAKEHLRVSTAADDALITRLIKAARRAVEAYTRQRLVTQTWRLYFDRFPCGYSGSGPQTGALVLPDVTPVSAIASVKYIDEAGALQTLLAAKYQLVPGLPARVYPAYGESWPTIRGDRDGVRVEVTSGFGGAVAVPEDIIQALLLILGHLYEHRERVMVGTIVAEIPFSADSLLSPYIVQEF